MTDKQSIKFKEEAIILMALFNKMDSRGEVKFTSSESCHGGLVVERRSSFNTVEKFGPLVFI